MPTLPSFFFYIALKKSEAHLPITVITAFVRGRTGSETNDSSLPTESVLPTSKPQRSERMATQQTAIEVSFVRPSPQRSRFAHFCQRTEGTINAHSGVVLISICTFAFAVLTAQSLNKLMWFDEFITFYIAKLGSLHAVWSALARGTDPNPPLSHWLASLSIRLFGANSFSTRLPFMLAGVAALFALFTSLRRRIPPLYAAAGVLFFMSTAAFDYFFEARSYALTLVFSALSLMLWQEATEGDWPRLSSVALGIVLAAGISSNYFAVLAFFPIAAGELVRNISQRRLEWRVWIALAVSGSTLFFYLPLIHRAVATFSPYAWNKVDLDTVADAYLQMVDYIVWLCGALVVARTFTARCVVPATPSGERSFLGHSWDVVRHTFFVNRQQPARWGLPWHEAVAVFFLILYPLLGYAVARIQGGMLAPRFVLPVCYGCAIAAATCGYKVFGKWPIAGLLLLATVGTWFLTREGEVASNYYDERAAFQRVLDLVPSDGTLLVSDSLLVLPMYYYAPPEIASRIVFPIDFRAIRQYKGEDSPEENLWAGRIGVFPVPIIPLNNVLDRTSSFLVVSTDDNWLLKRLEEDGDTPRQLPIFTDSRHIWAFTPLCHGPVWYFRNRAETTLTAWHSAPQAHGRAGQ